MTYEKGDRVHVKHPSGAEWDGVVDDMGANNKTVWLETGDLVVERWLTPIKPKIEPEVGDIGEFWAISSGYPLTEINELEKINRQFECPYKNLNGGFYENFRPIARKLKTWEELSQNEKSLIAGIRRDYSNTEEFYAEILSIALPGYPEITHARIGEDKS